MTAIGTVTGRHGKITIDGTLVARTTQWALNKTLATVSEWGDSDSYGWTNRAIGRRDATFTAEGKYDHGASIFSPLALGTNYINVHLWMGTSTFPLDGASVAPDSTLTWHFKRALALDFSMTVDMDTEEVVGWSGSFGTDGIVYGPGENGPTGDPDPDSDPTYPSAILHPVNESS